MDCDPECGSCDGCFDSKGLNFVVIRGAILEKLYPYKGVIEGCKVPSGINYIRVINSVKCVKKRSYD